MQNLVKKPGPGKKNWPPDKNLASGGRSGGKFLSGDLFFFWPPPPRGPPPPQYTLGVFYAEQIVYKKPRLNGFNRNRF